MKQYATILAVLLCLSNLAYGQTNFYSGDLDKMIAQASEENKSYIIEFVTPWCEACKRMDREVFVDNETAQYLNKNFYVIKVDAEDSPYAYLAKENLISAYPTFIVNNAKQEEQGRIVGYYSKHSFLGKVKNFRHKVPYNQYTLFR